MCGRFFLDSNIGEIVEHYNAPPPDIFTARYNIAPTTPVVARTDRELTFFRWGLVPSWAKDLSIGNRMFNARVETIAEKPSFRQAYRRRRCLIAANGFYEWRSENGVKQPYCCHIGQQLFSLAGIWEQWQDAEGNHLQSCAVITTEAKGNMRDIHQRMPVYIDPQDYQSWLDCRSEKTDIADELVRQTNPQYQYFAVSTAVNNSRHEGADLILPLVC
ncbi:MAG: SOS response-associated peptidase [Gammaproteobacteria bacterium]|nr:SOS response-associated peptidase [Gammaproteobacteria bacterium]